MSQRLRQAADVLTQELDGQTVLLAPGQAAALHLDEVATTVWQLLGTAPTHGDLVDAMAAAYDVPRARVEPDVQAVLALLMAHGAAEGVEPP